MQRNSMDVDGIGNMALISDIERNGYDDLYVLGDVVNGLDLVTGYHFVVVPDDHRPKCGLARSGNQSGKRTKPFSTPRVVRLSVSRTDPKSHAESLSMTITTTIPLTRRPLMLSLIEEFIVKEVIC